MRKVQLFSGTSRTLWEVPVSSNKKRTKDMCKILPLPSFSGNFEPFLKSYYDKFKYESIDSFMFKEFFLNYFKDNSNISQIQWDDWFNLPGMPMYKPNYDESLAKVSVCLIGYHAFL